MKANLNGWARFAAMACALVSFLALPASAAVAPADVTTTGSRVTTSVLPDQSTVVKFLADGTFTVPNGATARLLLVGGGGAGGRDCSGGGGAGGFVEASGVLLAAGTYSVTVGAGGQPTSSAGGNGGDMVLVDPDSTELYRAIGGGGGGSWGSKSGVAGGSGGGATDNGTGGAGTAGQGYAGGDAGNRAPAGGGGAGGAGSYGTNGNGPGTAGGPGKASDITGEEVYYAGGGGGGGFNSTAELINGGIGGGGNGARNVSVETRQGTTLSDGRNEYDAEAGTDGLGGGGGGANNGGNANDFAGRPGGSGVLIVRLDPVAAGPDPQIVVVGVENGPMSATVRVYLLSVGDDASTATVSYKVATSVAGLDAAEAVVAASGVTTGTVVPISITGLPGGKTYYVRVFAENDLLVAATPVDATANPIAAFSPTLFNYKAPFTVTGYAGAEPLTNFPVLVRLAANAPADFDYADCAADGSDIRFVDADGNLLPHEIDTWNPAGESLVWVGVPVVTNGATFAMLYGSETPGAPSADDVWTNYVAVVHGGASLENAVAGGQTVTAGSASVTAKAEPCKVGGGINKSDYLSIGLNVAQPSAKLDNTGRFSVSGWFKRSGAGGSNGNGTFVLGASRPGWQTGTGFLWLQEQGRYISVAANNNHQFSSGKYTLPEGNWGYAAFTYEKDVSLTTYYNGAQDNQKTNGIGNLASTDSVWTFGSYRDVASNDSFKGDMDELRIFNGVASGDWIKAEHDTVEVASFVTAGAVQPADPLAPRLVDRVLEEGIRRLDVSFACSMDGASVSYRVAAAGEDIDEATPVVLAASSTADARISFALTNLVDNGVYTILLEAEKDGHAAIPVRLTGTAWAVDPAFTPDVAANDVRTRVGADEVHTLSASGTFTLSTSRRVRLLAVGGGGGSGWGQDAGAGGGGAGGMLEVSNVLLRAGTYRYEVGAGGAASRGVAARGGNGGDTALYCVDSATGTETLVARAVGGGGGGRYDYDRFGENGGSGGGAVFRDTNNWGAGGSGVEGQGHAGGGWTANPGTSVGSGGGGGAGAPGEAGTTTKGGAGGDGRVCDITGTEVWYAGGGGGATRNNNATVRTPGKGGRGGGGNGADYGVWPGDPALDGADGLGGGGGGGLQWYANAGISGWRYCYGGRGGSGTLVLRFLAAPQAAPAFASASAAVTDRAAATFEGSVDWVGDGAATVDAVLTLDGVSETIATGLAVGDSFSVAKTVARGASVAWSLKLVNALGAESTAESGTLAVPADAPVAITATGASRTFTVGNDTVAVFTNTASAGSLVVPEEAWVEILVVGGGGAGGRARSGRAGAGGGAGGFVYDPAKRLAAGTYSITVGAGGKGREDGEKQSYNYPGANGADSIVKLGGADVLRAYGGSGGASSHCGNLTNVVAVSGSTGGAQLMATSNIGWIPVAANYATEGQGHRGGASAKSAADDGFPGGGGGAGAPGGAADGAAPMPGAGGDGLPCSITGEEVWYAGGGAGGAGRGANGANGVAAAGGKGGGGHGQRYQKETSADCRGVNGLGGGGGGGAYFNDDDNLDSSGTGHSGGCGTVIVRWRTKAVTNVELAPDSPVGGFRRGTVSGSVLSAGGDGATVAVEIGLSIAGSATTNWTQVATGLAAGDTYSHVFDGLANATTYAVAWRATSSAGGSATGDAGSFTTVTGAYLVPGSGSEGATITQVGNDSVYTYSNSAAAGTFVVQQAGYARLLLAGGGGAGGYYRAGGGGGGGVIEEDLVWLEAGTYSISVGAGGIPSTGSGSRGGNGGNSVLSGPGLALTAFGGGGGASWNDSGVANLGADGGCGGGSARRRETTAGKGVPGQGHDGAPSRRRIVGTETDRWSAGGGGGAGSPGIQASADHTVAGAGGAGRVSDISGSAEQYGAGGGASCTDYDSNAAGEGGDGIGGHGRRNEYTTYWFGDEPGRAGYGGGGGGGADRDWNSNFIRPGAPGGCGTVIIRFATAPAGKADAAVIAAEPSSTDPTAASVTVVVRSLGGAGPATLELAYGLSQSSLPLRHAVGTVTATGTIDAELSGLEPGRTYYVAAAISTQAGETVTRAVAVTIPPAGAIDGAGAAGLWQAQVIGDATSRAPDLWDSIVQKSVVAGTIAAIGTGDAVDPFTGADYAWAGVPSMFAYKGAIFLKGGTTYTFGSRMDDSLYLKIGDTAVIDTVADPSHSVFADFTAPWTGWYPLDVRLGNAVGDRAKHGPDGDGTTSWTGFALAYNTEGNRAMIPESAWSLLLDPGDGSFLRTEAPDLRYADTDVGATADGSLTLAASVAPGNETVHAYLCSGPSWGGNAPADWATTADLGEVAAANAATSLGEVQVSGWGTTAKVAAVALVHPDGTVTWSAPATYAGTSLFSLSAAATDWSQGDELEVSYTVAGGTGPYTATLYVGNGPGSLERAARATLNAAGTGTLRATGLTPSATYYWQVVVTDASGASASTDPSAYVEMPGAAEIVNSPVGISWTLDQRTATLNGSLLKLGAGDNWALLYVADRLSERWSNANDYYGSTTNSGEKVQLTDTGAFSITHTFDWGDEIGFNWVLSNSNGRVTYFAESRKPDNNNLSGNTRFWAGDYQTYTWVGGSGLWNDATKWSSDGTMEGHEQAGYPVTGSVFAFDAGESEVTLVPGKFAKPVAFDLRQNAKVTIKGTPESAEFGLLRTDKPLKRQSCYIRDGASLVLSGVKGRLAPHDDGTTIYFGGPNASLVFTNACDVDLGWSYGKWGIEDWTHNRVGGGIRFTGGSKVYIRGCLGMAGPNEYVIDDSQVTMAPSGNRDECRVHFAISEGGRFVFRGAHPLLVCNNRFSAEANNNPRGSSTSPQFVDFEIPVGGFVEAPLQSKTGNTYKLGVTGSDNYRMAFRVPTNSPAASVKGLLEQPLIYWPAGKETWMLTESQYLPHPDTDEWRETYDPITGEFTGWAAFLVCRPDIEDPQVVGLSLTNLVSGRADLFFYGIPGTNAASATFAAQLERTDDPTDTSATVQLSGGSAGVVSQGTRFTVAATGLVDGGSYRLTITGVDDGDATLTCTEILEFGAFADYGAASTASAGATTAQDGPYTVWTFTNSAAAGTLTVARPGVARILVVGGGGSGGGGDSTATNEGDTRRGGGGGGGGEVVETELYLQPGDYFVQIGAGGASVGTATRGYNGGVSSFAGLVTAAGGGGGGSRYYSGNTWYSAARDGASGGGAAGQGSAGGAATAAGGHAGGASSYNAWANNDVYAGAGGGAMGAAGGDAGLDALNMLAPGNGGDGVPSDITGSVVWYGGGGGGGGGGYAFGPGIGGLGGRGGGGEGRSRRTCTTFALESSAGADGFGGGGGGGASGGKLAGYPDALQAYYGGKGGAGAVIVRMRTATARTPDPQVSVRSAEPSAGGADFAVNVHSLGEGAAAADLLLVCTPAGSDAALTNVLGSVSATGVVSRAVAGLRPGTDYAGAVVATNAAGGIGSAPVAFRTAAEYHGDADSGLVAGEWTISDWNDNDTSFFSDNLLRDSNGGFASRAQNRKKSNSWSPALSNNSGWEGDLIDGAMRTGNRSVGYGTNELVVFTLSAPSAVSSMRFFSGWGVNSVNSSIAIEGIDVRTGANEPWTALANGACQAPASTTWGMFGTLAAGGNDWLARDVRQIRVRFDKNRAKNTNGTYYWEVEAQGAAETNAPALHARAGIGRPLAPASSIRTANAFSGVVSAPAGEPVFDRVVAAWGPVYGGEDTNDWAHVLEIGSMTAAASSLAVSLSGDDFAGTVYVRYAGYGADGTVSWSDSVYVPDLEVMTDVPPVVVFGSCSAAGATTATLEATLVSAGSLAQAQAADVTLEYTLDPDGFSEGWTGTPETFAFAPGAAVGAIPSTTVAPLRPNRRYLARLAAENDAHQIGYSVIFAFETADGGTSGATSGAGLIQAKFTTGQEDRTSDILGAPEANRAPVLGTIMANTSGSAQDSNGATWSWRDNTSFGYAGYMWMEAGKTYTFGKSVDDWGYVKIDGTVCLDDNNHAAIVFRDYPATMTGWIPVEFRFGNGGGGAGLANNAKWGFAFNTEGNRTEADFKAGASPWRAVVDPGDGSLLRPTAARSLEITGAEVVSGGVDVAAAATPGNPVGEVWAVWGATDLGAGAVLSDWTHKDLLGTADGAERAFAKNIPVTDPAATPVVRVAIVPTAGEILWSAPVLLDAEDPTIGPAKAATDGDRMTVSGTMASLGTGAGFALELLWGYEEDFSDAQRTNLVVDADGAFSGTVPVEPSTNGWWRLVARTTDGGVDATLPAAFETRGGSELKRLASAAVTHHTISASGTLNVLGAGTTTVAVWQSPDGETGWEPVAGSSKVLSTTGPFTLEALVPGAPHTVYWKIVSTNTAAGGTAWTSETPVYSIDTEDAVTYTWRAEVPQGDWNDSANWGHSALAEGDDCLGYPNHSKAKVVFLNETVAEIAVPAGTWNFESMDLNKTSLDLTFVGEGAGATTLYGNVWGADATSAWNGWHVVFDGLTLREENTITLGGSRSQDVTLRFQNGAYYSLAGWQESKGTNVWLEAVGGSTLYWRNGDGDTGSGLTLWVADGGLLLEDSTANPPNFNYERGNGTGNVGSGARCGDQSVLLKGESVFRVRTAARPYSETEDSGAFGALTISFFVPLDGWEAGVNTPVYANYVRGTSDNKMFAWRSLGKEVPVTLSVDQHSPLLQSGRSRTWEKGNAVQLVEWCAGIDTKNVVFEERKGVTMYYTYGFPQVRRTPTSPDEIPTGVAADVVGQAGTILIFK